MTIEEIKEQEEGEFTIVDYHEGTCRANMDSITELDVSDNDEVRDYWLEPCSDGDTKLHIMVQPKKAIRYIHVGAPAPQYAISSIYSIEGAIVQAAMAVGVYARTERSRNSIPRDIILEPDTTEDQVKEIFAKAKQDMIDKDYTGVTAGETTLYYDAGQAEAEVTEPTRNW